MNKPGSRIAVISVIKFWSSSPPSWYSKSNVVCGRKNNLLTRVLTFRKIRKFVYVLEMLIARHLGTPSSRHFRWLQFVSLYARSRFIHICGLTEVKRNALWCVRTRNFFTVIKIPSICYRNFCQFVVIANCVLKFTTFASICMASYFARRNLLTELVEELQ